jgi:hypothetical protein
MKAKLISESLNFERKNDPLVSLGVGKKSLITKWLDDMNVKNYIINDDYTIDVNGHVNIVNKDLKEIPYYIQFNIITLFFDCSGNYLISLKGCPMIVRSNFWCSYNNLTSLEYCPLIVEENFGCENNDIIFAPKDVRKICKVGGIIYT